MIRKVIIFLSILLCCKCSFAQKQPLTVDSYKNWQHLSGYDISNDGKYTWYEASNKASGESALFLVYNKDAKRTQLQSPRSSPFFTQDSRYLIYLGKGDSINILNLSKGWRQSLKGSWAKQISL